MADREEEPPLFAGIYKHHGGVKMRESSFAQGKEITKDFIVEASSGSPSVQGSDSDFSFPLPPESISTSNPSLNLNELRYTVGNHPPPTEPFVNICNNTSISTESSLSCIANGFHEEEAEASPVSGNFYEDIELLRQQNQTASANDADLPVGFDRDIDSSELDSLSSPSENFLYAEIEKSLDSSRDDLIVESIDVDFMPEKTSKRKPKFHESPTDEQDGLEVNGILQDLDKRSSSDPGSMLVGYGAERRADEVDEALVGSEPSTPSGYHSYTTEATLPKHLMQQPEEPQEPAEVPTVSRLQRMDALDDESVEANGSSSDVVLVQPTSVMTEVPMLFNCVPPGLDVLLEAGQLVVHLGSLRHDTVIDPGCRKRMEIVDETRKVLFYAEQGEPPYSEQSFIFHVYNRQHQEVINVYCPSSQSCICHGASWHWFRRCHFRAVVYAPVGCIAGFIRRSHTKFVQEFEILSPQEEILLLLRGAPNDLEIYSPDLENELGRLSVHGWRGIMHEIRRTRNDYGITFPLDLDVRIKAVLIGAIFSIDWLYSTKGGRVR